MTYANNLDPDEAPQNVGLHLRSKLFDIQIIYQQKKMGGNNEFFENFERKKKKLKKLPSMQRVDILIPNSSLPGMMVGVVSVAVQPANLWNYLQYTSGYSHTSLLMTNAPTATLVNQLSSLPHFKLSCFSFFTKCIHTLFAGNFLYANNQSGNQIN